MGPPPFDGGNDPPPNVGHQYLVIQWDWRLFVGILLFVGLPNVYNLYRVSLIGNEIPDPGSLAVVSQWQFVGLVVEVFQEATVLAIFFFLGSQIRHPIHPVGGSHHREHHRFGGNRRILPGYPDTVELHAGTGAGLC